MEKKPAVVSGGLGGLGGFKVKLFGDSLEFGFSAEDQHEPKVSGHFDSVSLNDSHDFVAKGLFALVGFHLVRLVDGANLPRRMISARLFSCGRTIVLQALI
jgi:hypothetical protein